ncbi:hypothetical protein NX773_12625 [Massilia solisilvae]|uniref:Uncharacterized protein n=1 Tax=Massilia solisilvae TaxID=1811225 RepID=A0ABT2BKG8_9BURK|nr:hypothetical protein [Massilia solisilvae]MCS0609009.1 hypothetical protein [Massilia solisilvae]
MMGNSLHNKIYLGRSSFLGSRRWQVAMVCGVLAAGLLTWAGLRGWH